MWMVEGYAVSWRLQVWSSTVTDHFYGANCSVSQSTSIQCLYWMCWRFGPQSVAQMDDWHPVGGFCRWRSAPEVDNWIVSPFLFTHSIRKWIGFLCGALLLGWTAELRDQGNEANWPGTEASKTVSKTSFPLYNLITSDILLPCQQPDKQNAKWCKLVLRFSLKGKPACQSPLFRFLLASTLSASAPNILQFKLSACSPGEYVAIISLTQRAQSRDCVRQVCFPC